MKSLNFRQQVPKNLFINLFSFVSTVVIGLWLTPYLLKHLGIVAYGLVPLAMFLSQYISVILNSINMSINRFLLISLQKEEDKEANEIFNTSFVIITFFMLIQALIMYIILFDITYFFEIPENLIIDSMWLFGLTFIGFSISLFRAVFGTSLYAYNRLDILRIIDISQKVIHLLSILVFFSYDGPSLKYVGIANLVAALSAMLITIYYFKKYTPQLKINFSFFRKKYVSKISKTSIWILINQVGALLLGSIDLYLVNKLIGTHATGEYSIVIQIISLFKTLTILVAGVINPVIMIYYANNEFEKLKKILFVVIKGLSIIMIIPLTIVIGLSENLINLWLGSHYKYLHSLISFSLLFFIVSIPITPLFNINIAYNKVQLPAIIALSFGIVNILCIYLFSKYTNFELWGIVITKLFLEIIFGFFIIIHVSKVLSMKLWVLLRIPIFSIFIFIITYGLVIISKEVFNMDLLVHMILATIIIILITLPLLIFLVFSKEEISLLFQNKRKK